MNLPALKLLRSVDRRLLSINPLKSRGCTRHFSSAQHFDPYQILQVAKDADTSTIKKSYLKLVFDLHPDRQNITGGHKEQKEQFLRVVKSYEILNNPTKRQQYDLDASMGLGSRYSSKSYPQTSDYAYRWQSTGEDYHNFYYHSAGQTTEPRYMSNGRMAFIIAVCALVSAAFTFLHIRRMRHWFVSQMDRRDEALRDHLKRTRDQARVNGSLESSIDSLVAKQSGGGSNDDGQSADPTK
ncbi:hypothetical protein SeLEV6574_g02510 [Synchytrium endobioticum]|nr:hypothetical protein SeLEV6574_g02510 [Synchytrium endobioticum]